MITVSDHTDSYNKLYLKNNVVNDTKYVFFRKNASFELEDNVSYFIDVDTPSSNETNTKITLFMNTRKNMMFTAELFIIGKTPTTLRFLTGSFVYNPGDDNVDVRYATSTLFLLNEYVRVHVESFNCRYTCLCRRETKSSFDRRSTAASASS